MFLSNLTELTMSQGYRRFFKVVPALTDELRAENYRIRHEVYCREPVSYTHLTLPTSDLV